MFPSILRTQQLKQLDLVTLWESLLGNSPKSESRTEREYLYWNPGQRRVFELVRNKFQ
jgi:hypothetical protein